MKRRNHIVSDVPMRKKLLKKSVRAGNKASQNKQMRSATSKRLIGSGPQRAQTGEFLKRTKVGALNTPAQWLRQLGKVYRKVRRGEIDPIFGRHLGYLLNMGLNGAKEVADSDELKLLRQKLEDIGALPPSLHLNALPAIEHGEDDLHEPVP